MSSSSVSVLAEPDQVRELATFLAALRQSEDATVSADSSLIKEYVALAHSNKYSEVIEKAIGDIELAATRAGDQEYENLLMLMAALLYDKCNESTFGRIAPKILEAVVTKGQSKGVVTLSALTFAVTDKEKYAAAVRPALNGLEQRLILLGASASERRAIYDLALELFPESEAGAIADLQIKLLKTYEDATNAQAVEKAKSIVAYQIGNPHVRFTDTLLALPVVAQLKGTPLYQLLEIFATKDFKAFADFAAHHTELFATLGLNRAELEAKMRLLTLADLGASHASLSFALISDALSVPEADVELYIVDAIASGLLDARIDQSAKSVIVVHAPQRTFQPAQWAQLGTRVNEAQEHLKSLLSVIRQLRQQNIAQLGLAK